MIVVLKDTTFEQAELVTQLLRRNYYVASEFDNSPEEVGAVKAGMVRHLVLDLSKPTGDHNKVDIARQLDGLYDLIEQEVRKEYAEKLDHAEQALEEAYRKDANRESKVRTKLRRASAE